MPGIPKYTFWMGLIKTFPKGWPPACYVLLNKINEEVKLYGQAFSPMAKRNVALAIHELIAKFATALKEGRRSGVYLPKELADLDAAAVKEASIVASAHKYDFVSCIGYGVITGKFDANLFQVWWSSGGPQWSALVEYAGQSTDTADYLAKCNHMTQAIESAYLLHDSKYGTDVNNARTLKIFMAPEFYFRGIRGAYNIKSVSEIFTRLRRLSDAPKFKDWLFVFGTVIAATFNDVLTCRSCGKSGKQLTRVGPNKFTCPGCPADSVAENRVGATIDNVALIQKGGETGFENSYVIEKEYVSHIDFRRYAGPAALRQGRAMSGNPGDAVLKGWDADRRIEIMGKNLKALPVPGSRDIGGSASKFTDERMGGSIFTIDGIKFGLEICLDHLNAKIAPGSAIQIQLVPSAGAFLQQFACVLNGIAFNVDGGAGTCDVRVNGSGTAPNVSTAPGNKTGPVPGGGEIKVYEPQPIPYA